MRPSHSAAPSGAASSSASLTGVAVPSRPRQANNPPCRRFGVRARRVTATAIDRVNSQMQTEPSSWASNDHKPLPSFSKQPVTIIPPQPKLDNMMSGQATEYIKQDHHKTAEEIWQAVRAEAAADAEKEIALSSSLYSSILVHRSLEKTMAHVLANKLSSKRLMGTHLVSLFEEAYREEPSLMEGCVADMNAVFDRDPACDKYTHSMLNFKGFQAVQSQRLAHWLWKKGRKPLAYALQSRMSEVFHVDIHPGAQIGRGIMIDHATGVVIGETAVIGDNVSILHHVVLGGSGTGKGTRHPHIGHGVLLGAGVVCLGPITVGHGSKVGAGSLVVRDLPDYCVAVGVPAKVLRRKEGQDPNQTMDQTEYIYDYII